MGVERSLDYLRVKARGQQAVKCQPSDLLTSQIRRWQIRVCCCQLMVFLFWFWFLTHFSHEQMPVTLLLAIAAPRVHALFKQMNRERPEVARCVFTE